MADLRIRPADDPPSFLAVLLDADVGSWTAAVANGDAVTSDTAVAAVQALKSAAEQVLVFVNTFLLLHEENRVAFLVYARDGSHVAYPRMPDADAASAQPDAAKEEDDFFDACGGGSTGGGESTLHALREGVSRAIAASVEAQALPQNAQRPVRVSPSLATALCMINRRRMIRFERPGVPEDIKQGALHAVNPQGMRMSSKAAALGGQARMLAVVASTDVPEQYVPVMNCIFSAQRMNVPVDTCLLSWKDDSTYFQQAAHLTGGIYMRPTGYSPEDAGTLLHPLLTVFLADSQSREFLSMPGQEEVDFRASCFSTRKVIQEGYTCSVCLSTFDISVGKKAFSCPTCQARFATGMQSSRPPLARRAGGGKR